MKGSIREAVARSQGLHTVELMLDISSFYECVNIPRMVRAVRKKGMPLSLATLSLWGHGARRFMRLRGVWEPQGLTPGKLISTGCDMSTSIARGVVAEPVGCVVSTGGGKVHHSVFIDDIQQQTSGSETAIVRDICSSGGELVGALQRLGSTLPSKSCIVSSSKTAIRQIQRFFKRVYNVDIEAPRMAEHLGHARTSDPRSTFRVIRRRFHKAARRTSRIR